MNGFALSSIHAKIPSFASGSLRHAPDFVCRSRFNAVGYRLDSIGAGDPRAFRLAYAQLNAPGASDGGVA